MTRKLKTLGLTLAAVFAFSAIAAGAANATVIEHSFTSDSSTGNTTLTGVNEGNEVFSAAPGTSIICKTAKFAGTQAGNKADEVTVTAEYGATTAPSGCEDTALGAEAIVHFNHCAYVFDSDTLGGTHAAASVECQPKEISPPVEKNEIEITVAGVIFTVGPQTVGQGVTYTEVGKDITVTSTANKIKMTCMGGVLCELICGASKVCENGTYNGKTLISGYKDSTAVTGTNKTTYAGYNGTHNEANRVDLGLSTP